LVFYSLCNFRLLNYPKGIPLGVREEKTNDLVGFIFSFPVKIMVNNSLHESVEVNFLCLEKRYRALKIAPILINEITRLNNQIEIFNAIFTTGNIIAQPFARARYFHLPLNIEKLKRNEFLNFDFCSQITPYENINKIKVLQIEKLAKNETDMLIELLNSYYSSNFDVFPIFDVHTFDYLFLNNNKFIHSFVGYDSKCEIVSFISLYILESKVLKYNEKIQGAYIFHYFAKDSGYLLDTFNFLVASMHEIGIDVLNCLNIMNNYQFLESLGFQPGDGFLNYYLYNIESPIIPLDKMAYSVF
jgi:glycylpeptide N-tetradecanoyltransferase